MMAGFYPVAAGIGAGLLGDFGSGLMGAMSSSAKGMGAGLVSGLLGGGGGSGDDFENAYWLQQDANATSRYSEILHNQWNLNYQNIANQNAAQAATDAYQRNLDMYANRYRTTAYDMKQAGLNPILAATGGFSVGGQPTIAPAQSFSGNAPGYAPSYNVASAAKDIASMRLMEEQAQKTRAETSYTEKQTEKTDTDIKQVQANTELAWQKVNESIDQASKLRAEKELINAEEQNALEKFKEIQMTIKNLEMQNYKIAQEIRESESRQTLNYSTTDVNRAKIGEIKANIGRIQNETQNLAYQGKELAAIADVYSTGVGASLVLAERAAKGGYLGNILKNYYQHGTKNPMTEFLNNLKIPYGR